jgi:hypothetical protein
MKKISFILLAGIAILSSGCFNRIGKLMMVSTRNVDSDMSDYVLLSKEIKGVAKTKKEDALEVAIDNAVKKLPTGEFMKNAIFYVSSTGKRIKVVGDIWGYKPAVAETVDKNITQSVNAKIEFKIGDRVTFKKLGKLYEGKILGFNADFAIVEYKDLFGKVAKSELKYEELTKLGE